ncbi:MAG: hypothetical protein NT157_02485 [Candidatus Micrarchaeota archaeon]|nr:hypothetical protein [Candidatus Micrarchaeota archaeon]
MARMKDLESEQGEEQKPETGRLAGHTRHVESTRISRRDLLVETIRVMKEGKTKLQK